MESCSKTPSTAQYARCVTRWRLPITDTVQQWQNHLQVKHVMQFTCLSYIILYSMLVYRFSRLTRVVDIGDDFNLNSPYFLIFGRRLMGK